VKERLVPALAERVGERSRPSGDGVEVGGGQGEAGEVGVPPVAKRPSTKLGVAQPNQSRARRRPVQGSYVAVDLDRKRGMVVIENEAGECTVERIVNDPSSLVAATRGATGAGGGH
jgi:hypothetical protein